MNRSRIIAAWWLLALSAAQVASQPLGSTFVAGNSWYDMQHQTTCGRMVAEDDLGFVHLVWTRGLGVAQRNVYFNVWEPQTEAFSYPNGVALEPSGFAGMVTLALDGELGCPLPAYRGGTAMIAVAPCALLSVAVPDSPTGVRASPHIARDPTGQVHVIRADPESAIQNLFYSRGHVLFDIDGWVIGVQWDTLSTGEPWEAIGSASNTSYTLACSRHNGRTAAAWLEMIEAPGAPSNYNNDVVLRTSDDGGETWNLPVNVTRFVAGDTACYDSTHDYARCNRDTLRAYPDLSLLFDESNVAHVAFTTVGFFTWNESGEGPFTAAGASRIWHWDEAAQRYSLVAEGWVQMPHRAAWQTCVMRPSLALDTTNGYLYCAYLRYSQVVPSEAGYPNADVWISVSTDGGLSWSVGTNVTRSTPDTLPAPAGQSLSERDPTLAEAVGGGILHLTYELDRDAGCAHYNEGVLTLNDFAYQRVPADSIPAQPLLPPYPLHYDSSGFSHAREPRESWAASSCRLDPPYPNPFNDRAMITFELAQRAHVRLSVYNVLGRETACIVNGAREAGKHSVEWTPTGLSSGLYFLRLETPFGRRLQKVVYIR